MATPSIPAETATPSGDGPVGVEQFGSTSAEATPEKDRWAYDYDFFMVPQEEVDYIRSIDSHETFQRELNAKIEASGNAKKIRKILEKLDAPTMQRFQSFAAAVRAVSHDSYGAQSSLWGGLLVCLTYSFKKPEFLKDIVGLVVTTANILPKTDPYLDRLAKTAPSGNPTEATRLRELQEPIRLLHLNVTSFTHTTALMLWLKLGLSSSLPMGWFSRKITQKMTLPFFLKTLNEDFERTRELMERDAQSFDWVAQDEHVSKGEGDPTPLAGDSHEARP